VHRKLGIGLIGLGVFLVTAAALLRFHAYDRLAVVPLDQDSRTVSDGPDATVFDIARQREVTLDLQSTRRVVGDVDASNDASDDEGRDLAVWETLVVTDEPDAVIDEDNPPRSATHDRVVFDRNTGEAVDCCGYDLSSSADSETGEEIRDTETPITGQYFKLPFGTEKRTYQFWDGALKDATDLEYQDTETMKGLTVYKFQQVIDPTDVGDIEAPASFFGLPGDGNVTLDRIYANTRTLWVEPETGVIIKGQEDQHVVAEYQGDEVATLTDVVIAYNDDTVTKNVDKYSGQATSLKAVRLWVPIAGVVLGLLLVAAGLWLVLRDRRPRDQPEADQREDVPAGSGR
jgi:hypothetical protein